MTIPEEVAAKLLNEPMTQGQYLAVHGGQCPFCRSNNISAEHITCEGTEAWCEVECNDCERVWQDTFTMTGYSAEFSE